MITITDKERRTAHRHAEIHLARQHPEHFQELYRAHRAEGVERARARQRALRQLPREYGTEFHAYYDQAITDLQSRMHDELRAVMAGTMPRYITDEFMDEPRRGCAQGKGVDPEIFFDLKAPSAPAAREICRKQCPFTGACFAWAEKTGQEFGIWGGVDMASAEERAIARDMVAVPA